jgi:TonB family protein
MDRMTRTRTLRGRRAAAAALLPLLAGAAACRHDLPPITPPRLVSSAAFLYPEELWDAGVEGQTTLRIFVTPAGTVDSVRVEVPAKHAAFDSAAVAGSRVLRFEPARRGEEPVGAWYRLPVRFDLTPAATQPDAPR